MALLLEDEICAHGTPVYKISWFVLCPHTLLLASPTADCALRHHADTAPLHSGDDDDADLDFVLYDQNCSAGGDKKEVVDYAFLTAQPQPPRTPGQQTLVQRQAQLKTWIEACFLAYNRSHFPELLREASPALFFEYDSVLRSIGSATGEKGGAGPVPRSVQGLVLPTVDGSGATVVDLVIPLLLSHTQKAFQALSNVAVLYCKFAQHVWRKGYQVSTVEADLHVRIRAPPKKGKLTVLTEEVELRITDCSNGVASESLVPFLKSCLNLSGLPRLSLNQQGEGFIDYLPQLDDTLYRRLREPLHFVKLILGLSADFGSPVECSVSCRPLSRSDIVASLSRKTAVFCVVDAATSIGFTVGVHYHCGEELPSIEATCLQYLDTQHDAPLSAKVQYPKTGAAMRKDDDGFVDVEELRHAVVRGVMDCMAQSMTVA